MKEEKEFQMKREKRKNELGRDKGIKEEKRRREKKNRSTKEIGDRSMKDGEEVIYAMGGRNDEKKKGENEGNERKERGERERER